LYDCLAAYRWLLSQGFQPARIAIAGDSMGGLLTLTAALALRDSHEPLPAALVCLSPNTDGTVSGRSMHANAWRDALLSPQFARRTMSLFAGKRDRRDPCLSPLHAELHELPPILLQAGADEILLDDSRCFAERALAAGAAVTLQIWPGMWHDWQLSVPELPEAKEAIRCVSEFLHKHLVTAVERG
jgi:acetyl esterase/lipase